MVDELDIQTPTPAFRVASCADGKGLHAEPGKAKGLRFVASPSDQKPNRTLPLNSRQHRLELEVNFHPESHEPLLLHNGRLRPLHCLHPKFG